MPKGSSFRIRNQICVTIRLFKPVKASFQSQQTEIRRFGLHSVHRFAKVQRILRKVMIRPRQYPRVYMDHRRRAGHITDQLAPVLHGRLDVIGVERVSQLQCARTDSNISILCLTLRDSSLAITGASAINLKIVRLQTYVVLFDLFDCVPAASSSPRAASAPFLSSPRLRLQLPQPRIYRQIRAELSSRMEPIPAYGFLSHGTIGASRQGTTTYLFTHDSRHSEECALVRCADFPVDKWRMRMLRPPSSEVVPRSDCPCLFQRSIGIG